MARKLDSLKIPKGWPTPPFIMKDRASIAGRDFLVLERTVGGWRAVRTSIGVEIWLGDETITDGQCSLHGKRRFFPWDHNTNLSTGEQRSFDDHLAAYRQMALQRGATPEAIRLLHENYLPFKNKEVDDMAKKISKKDGKAPAKKAATKKADTKKAATKKKEAASSEPDTRKITALAKENPFREGSARAEAYDLMKSSKTVQDYKDAGGPTKYINRWAGEGHIKLA